MTQTPTPKNWNVYWRDWHTNQAKTCDPEYKPYHLERAKDYVFRIACDSIFLALPKDGKIDTFSRDQCLKWRQVLLDLENEGFIGAHQPDGGFCTRYRLTKKGREERQFIVNARIRSLSDEDARALIVAAMETNQDGRVNTHWMGSIAIAGLYNALGLEYGRKGFQEAFRRAMRGTLDAMLVQCEPYIRIMGLCPGLFE